MRTFQFSLYVWFLWKLLQSIPWKQIIVPLFNIFHLFLSKHGKFLFADSFRQFAVILFQMPDSMVALLMRFLEQNNGELSKRAREKEFAMLTGDEVKDIEKRYNDLFARDKL